MQINTVEELIEDIRQGRMVILMDDEDRENEGDLIMAAEMVRPEDINFMARYACGLICLTLSEERCRQLALPPMVQSNRSGHGTNFTVSIEAAEGVTTGISAADRARTVQAAVGRNARPEDIVQPGHIFPLKAQPGGVLSRAGHTEAGCDLSRLAGFEPAAVIVEVMNNDGTMARRPDLERFAEEHGIKIGTIADLIHYRILNEQTVTCIGDHRVPTAFGEFDLKVFLDDARQEKHFALVKGEISADTPTLVRVHTSSTVRDLFVVDRSGPHKSWTFQKSLERVAQEGAGVVLLIYDPETADDVEADVLALLGKGARRINATDMVYQQVGAGSQILRELGVGKMRLMGAPIKYTALSGFDLEVVEYVNPV